MIASITGTIKLLIDLFGLAKELFFLVKQAKIEGWIQDGRELSQAIKGAKTDEERKDLVRKLVGHSQSTPN